MVSPLSPRGRQQKPRLHLLVPFLGQVSLHPHPSLSQIPHPLRRRPPRRDPPPPGTRRSLLPFLAPEPILPRDPLISPGIWIGRRTRSFIFVRKRGRAVWIACVVGGAWCARSALARLRFDSIAVDVMRLSIGGVASRQAMCPRSGILIDMIGDVVFSDFGARLICLSS
jgi:hypothetical protein